MSIFMISVGGALGASSRYLISSFLNNYSILSFTLGTLVVNIIGCFIIGFYISETSEVISENIKTFLIIGFLGSFTTFSAFTQSSLALYHTFVMTNSFLYI